MEKNPANGLKLPKVPKKKIRFLSQDDIDAIYSCFESIVNITLLNLGLKSNFPLPNNSNTRPKQVW